MSPAISIETFVRFCVDELISWGPARPPAPSPFVVQKGPTRHFGGRGWLSHPWGVLRRPRGGKRPHCPHDSPRMCAHNAPRMHLYTLVPKTDRRFVPWVVRRCGGCHYGTTAAVTVPCPPRTNDTASTLPRPPFCSSYVRGNKQPR